MSASVAHSMELEAEFAHHGVDCRHLDARTPDEERAEIFADYDAGKLKILLSVGVLNTGFDAPIASYLAIARPTKSLMLHRQMVGRVLRHHPDKDHALIYDHAGNYIELGSHLDDTPTVLCTGKKNGSSGSNKPDREYIPKPCTKCKALREKPGPCPSCGHKPVPQDELVREVTEVKLKQIVGNPSLSRYAASTAQQRASVYAQMLAWCKLNKKKEGMAYYRYKEFYGVAPSYQNMAPPPLKISPAVNNFMRAGIIRYAKGRAKAS